MENENQTNEVQNADTGEKTTKSIVPAKYAGRYKSGGTDALAEFINSQCRGKDGFEYSAFFELCRKNGVSEDQIAKYQGQIAEKRHGSQGRTRMTLRNMLATKARKDGKIVDLNGNEVAIELPKTPLSGAAAAAKDKQAQSSGGEAASEF